MATLFFYQTLRSHKPLGCQCQCLLQSCPSRSSSLLKSPLSLWLTRISSPSRRSSVTASEFVVQTKMFTPFHLLVSLPHMRGLDLQGNEALDCSMNFSNSPIVSLDLSNSIASFLEDSTSSKLISVLKSARKLTYLRFATFFLIIFGFFYFSIFPFPHLLPLIDCLAVQKSRTRPPMTKQQSP